MSDKLKPQMKAAIERYHQDPRMQIIKEFLSWKFSVGDVLIMKRAPLRDDKYEVVMVSPTCPVPKKYVVVHIDEYGIPWVKTISVRGGLGSAFQSLLQFDAGNTKFLLDPKQAEAQILGFKYDPRAEYRTMREHNPDYGGSDATREDS